MNIWRLWGQDMWLSDSRGTWLDMIFGYPKFCDNFWRCYDKRLFYDAVDMWKWILGCGETVRSCDCWTEHESLCTTPASLLSDSVDFYYSMIRAASFRPFKDTKTSRINRLWPLWIGLEIAELTRLRVALYLSSSIDTFSIDTFSIDISLVQKCHCRTSAASFSFFHFLIIFSLFSRKLVLTDDSNETEGHMTPVNHLPPSRIEE